MKPRPKNPNNLNLASMIPAILVLIILALLCGAFDVDAQSCYYRRIDTEFVLECPQPVQVATTTATLKPVRSHGDSKDIEQQSEPYPAPATPVPWPPPTSEPYPAPLYPTSPPRNTPTLAPDCGVPDNAYAWRCDNGTAVPVITFTAIP